MPDSDFLRSVPGHQTSIPLCHKWTASAKAGVGWIKDDVVVQNGPIIHATLIYAPWVLDEYKGVDS
jgi:hypothetical protein